MERSEILHRIQNVLSPLLKVEPTAIDVNTSRASLESWDSLAHLMIYLTLEDEFQVHFTSEQITSGDTIGKIVIWIEEFLS